MRQEGARTRFYPNVLIKIQFSTHLSIFDYVHTMSHMSVQTSTSEANGIPAGLGQRLKEERKRLKWSQTEMGQIGGIGRLAQLQYESEATAPTTRYLSLIGARGVNLAYVVLGIRLEDAALSPEQLNRVENRAFEWVEKIADAQPDKRLSAETRRFLYQTIRGVLVQVELGRLPEDFDANVLLNQHLGMFNKG